MFSCTVFVLHPYLFFVFIVLHFAIFVFYLQQTSMALAAFFFVLCTLYFFVLIVMALPFVLTVQHTQHKHP